MFCQQPLKLGTRFRGTGPIGLVVNLYSVDNRVNHCLSPLQSFLS